MSRRTFAPYHFGADALKRRNRIRQLECDLACALDRARCAERARDRYAMENLAVRQTIGSPEVTRIVEAWHLKRLEDKRAAKAMEHLARMGG
jgi:hypothetical protein